MVALNARIVLLTSAIKRLFSLTIKGTHLARVVPISSMQNAALQSQSALDKSQPMTLRRSLHVQSAKVRLKNLK